MRPPRLSIFALPDAALTAAIRDQGVPFPNLRDLVYVIAARPERAGLRAWVKLEESERRLIVLRWVIAVMGHAQPQYHVLLDDAQSAFLYSFEATLQILKDEFEAAKGKKSFERWLARIQANHDLLVFKGVRTLRHLEAHVRTQVTPSTLTFHPPLPGTARITTRWQLSPITEEEWNGLRNPPLELPDVPAWNALVKNTPIDVLMESALAELARVVQTGDRHLLSSAA